MDRETKVKEARRVVADARKAEFFAKVASKRAESIGDSKGADTLNRASKAAVEFLKHVREMRK